MKLVAVTNNILIEESVSKSPLFNEVAYQNCSYLDVLKSAKDRIKKGSRLLNSPLSGNLSPFEMSYKTLILTEPYEFIDFDSVNIINEAIRKTQKILSERPSGALTRDDLADFMKIDLILVERWFVKIFKKTVGDDFGQ